MGGPNSGNRYHWWRHGKKTTVEDCLTLDINRLVRDTNLQAGIWARGSWRWTYRSGKSFSVDYEVETLTEASPYLHLSYSWVWPSRPEVQQASYSVDLTTTRPHLGGVRWWFICPLLRGGRPCRRRVCKLYLPPHARYFGCRRCHDLTYTSCQESHKNDGLYRFMAREMGWDFDTAKRAMDDIGRRR
jgi:hypothetical protein